MELACRNCEWVGEDMWLVATDDDQDFTHCPSCGGEDFKELEPEDNYD